MLLLKLEKLNIKIKEWEKKNQRLVSHTLSIITKEDATINTMKTIM